MGCGVSKNNGKALISYQQSSRTPADMDNEEIAEAMESFDYFSEDGSVITLDGYVKATKQLGQGVTRQEAIDLFDFVSGEKNCQALSKTDYLGLVAALNDPNIAR
mmetsp:Transcript_19200/g.41728  ORF Transcript_19200/g.41728 Transcript_19200/m.41728 type:complete len:105 (+) Transcript_19200:51-365(+)